MWRQWQAFPFHYLLPTSAFSQGVVRPFFLCFAFALCPHRFICDVYAPHFTKRALRMQCYRPHHHLRMLRARLLSRWFFCIAAGRRPGKTNFTFPLLARPLLPCTHSNFLCRWFTMTAGLPANSILCGFFAFRRARAGADTRLQHSLPHAHIRTLRVWDGRLFALYL